MKKTLLLFIFYFLSINSVQSKSQNQSNLLCVLLVKGISTTDIKTDGAKLNWTAYNMPWVKFRVEYKLVTDTEWSVAHSAFAGRSFSISGLKPGSAYSWRIKRTCGGSYSKITSFVTSYAVFSIKNGDWNNISTWNTNKIPEISDNVKINHSVNLIGDIKANKIFVSGILKPLNSDTNFNITTKGIMVMGEGSLLEIGNLTRPYTGKANINLIGTKSTEDLFFGMNMGTKVIGAMHGGIINMKGADKKSWVNLASDATENTKQITVSEPVNWQVGDEIVITASRLSIETDKDFNITWKDEAEKRTISSISNNIIEFTKELKYPHTGSIISYKRETDQKEWKADVRAEVGLLSHNIRIEGDLESDLSGFGGHIMIMSGGKAFLDGVELYKMGQKSKLGRYPFHWHLLANGGKDQYIKNSSIHKSFNRAITIHGTHGTVVENNFAYDHIGHGIFLEDGSEINNLIKGNVVLLTKKPAQGEQLTPSDNEFDVVQNRTPASYWITNPNNTFINNIAAGTQGTGFWYAFPQDFMGPSKGNSLFVNQKKPYQETFGGFDGNKAHSCVSGFDIFDRLDATHSIVANGGWEEPNLKYFNNNTWYANHLGVYTGIGIVANNTSRDSSSKVIFKNNVFIENTTSTMLASYSIIDESVFIAYSQKKLLYINNNTENERFLYRVYDGAGTVKNSYFVGWDKANSNFLQNTGAAIKHTNASFENITADYKTPIRLSYLNYNFGKKFNYGLNENQPTVWGTVLLDKTGSITGKPNYSVVSNHPMLLVGDEATFDTWTNMHYTPRKYIHSRLQNYNIKIYPFEIKQTIPKHSITRSKINTPTISFYDVFSSPFNHTQMSLIVNDDFLYTYQFESLPKQHNLTQYVSDATIGDHYISRYKDFGKLKLVYVRSSHGKFPRYFSLSKLKNSKSGGYFKEFGGDLYLKTVAVAPDQLYTIIWGFGFKPGPLDSDGDGYTDATEILDNFKRNPNLAYDLGFNFSSNSDGWKSKGTIGSTFFVNNAWEINSNGNDPIITRDHLGFNANDVPIIHADVEADITGEFQLFWTTQDEPNFSEDKSIKVDYNTLNKRDTLAFNVEGNSKWNGKIIKSLRLDPPGLKGKTRIYKIYAAEFNKTNQKSALVSNEKKEYPIVEEEIKLDDSGNIIKLNQDIHNTYELFPNPTNGLFNVKEYFNNIQIYNIHNQLVKSFSNKDTLTVIDLSSGLYFVKIITNNGTVFRRLIKN